MFQAHSFQWNIPSALTLWILLSPCALAQGDFEIPEGFEIIEICSQDLAPDIYTLEFTARADPIVAGKGYLRILKDTDHDGMIDDSVAFADTPGDGAMGLLWEGDHLYVTGDGGLWRYSDEDRDDIADGTPEFLAPFRTGGEHGCHAIRRGPEGGLYILCGNEGGAEKRFASTEDSPIQDPIAGGVVRFSPDFGESEIVADGFRNAYDFDFNPAGDLFVYDSDNERDVSLPFYEPTRLYHVTPGFHYGWENPQFARTWRMPPHFYDVDRPIATLGRGSPTGVVCYRGAGFPERYRGGLFLADWTFGRIYFCPLEAEGSTYHSDPEVFVQSLGSNGFAPTDLAIHPESGDLYISIGGRGTRGAVYRVRYTGRVNEEPIQKEAKTESSLASALDTIVQANPTDTPTPELQELIAAHLDSADRKIRQAVSHLIARTPPQFSASLVKSVDSSTSAITLAWGGRENHPEAAADLLQTALSPSNTGELRTDAVRLFQVLLGDLMAENAEGTVWEGYSRRGLSQISGEAEKKILDTLTELFLSGDHDLDFELARTFGMVESRNPIVLEKLSELVASNLHPSDDIHYLTVLGRIDSPRNATQTHRIVQSLILLEHKIESREMKRDRHFPQRLSEVYAALSEKDPNLNSALLENPRFGRPGHSIYVQTEGFPKDAAAQKVWELQRKNPVFEWTPEWIALLEYLHPELADPLLRKLAEESPSNDTVIRILAKRPGEKDRAIFFRGLSSWNPETIEASIEALSQLPPPENLEEWGAVIEALKRQPNDEAHNESKRVISEYLASALDLDEEMSEMDNGSELMAGVDPAIAELWEKKGSKTLGEWKDRLKGIDWPSGDPVSGEEVYQRVGCADCHTGLRTLGPDLQGVTQRFSREDLMTAILDPSRDVPSRYRALTIETHDGDLVQGLVVYKAVDSVILQNGPDSTYRVEGKDIHTEYSSDTSIMPTGLLDTLTDSEVADLYAYLKSLTGKGSL